VGLRRVQDHRDLLAAFHKRDPDLVEQVFRRYATAGVELVLDDLDLAQPAIGSSDDAVLYPSLGSISPALLRPQASARLQLAGNGGWPPARQTGYAYARSSEMADMARRTPGLSRDTRRQ
jgi:hypothetical protein